MAPALIALSAATAAAAARNDETRLEAARAETDVGAAATPGAPTGTLAAAVEAFEVVAGRVAVYIFPVAHAALTANHDEEVRARIKAFDAGSKAAGAAWLTFIVVAFAASSTVQLEVKLGVINIRSGDFLHAFGVSEREPFVFRFVSPTAVLHVTKCTEGVLWFACCWRDPVLGVLGFRVVVQDGFAGEACSSLRLAIVWNRRGGDGDGGCGGSCGGCERKIFNRFNSRTDFLKPVQAVARGCRVDGVYLFDVCKHVFFNRSVDVGDQSRHAIVVMFTSS